MASTALSETPKANSSPSFYFKDADELARVFNRFDANGDGKISADELTSVLQSLGSDTSPDEIRRMMHQIDTDLDGFITLNEFSEFCKAGDGEINSDGGIKEAFELYDSNKNGLISSAELHEILVKLGERCTEEDCVKMIKTVDFDGDGCVNFEEFKIMMMSKK